MRVDACPTSIQALFEWMAQCCMRRIRFHTSSCRSAYGHLSTLITCAPRSRFWRVGAYDLVDLRIHGESIAGNCTSDCFWHFYGRRAGFYRRTRHYLSTPFVAGSDHDLSRTRPVSSHRAAPGLSASVASGQRIFRGNCISRSHSTPSWLPSWAMTR